MERRRTDRETGKVTIATVYAFTSRHELPGVEDTYSDVTLTMEERIVGYLGVWEKEVAGAGLWAPLISRTAPRRTGEPAPPLASGLPTLEYQ